MANQTRGGLGIVHIYIIIPVVTILCDTTGVLKDLLYILTNSSLNTYPVKRMLLLINGKYLLK